MPRPSAARLSDDEDRAIGGIRYESGDRTPKEIDNRPVAAGANDDEVGLVQIRAGDDGVGDRRCAASLAYCPGNSSLPRSTQGFIEVAFYVVFCPTIDRRTTRTRKDCRIDHVEHQLRRQLLGQIDGEFQGILRMLCVIDGAKDLSDHDCLSGIVAKWNIFNC